MKNFFKPNKFKLIFILIYLAILYFAVVFGKSGASYTDGLFYSFKNFVVWLMAWPVMSILRIVDWYKRTYESCDWLCLPNDNQGILILIVEVVYVYILSGAVDLIWRKKE